MKSGKYFLLITIVFLGVISCSKNKSTTVSIKDNQFYINGELTYKGVKWNNYPIEGLLMNARMVQGIFDDLNPNTKSGFIYPDTKTWDADRNTNEFVMAMGDWYDHGLLAFTLNMQGGSPLGYGNEGWINSAFDPKGELRPDYMLRLQKILDKADQLGMVVILGYFYFGQDEHLENEQAVVNAVNNISDWLIKKGYRNILVEIANECDIYYDHNILKPERIVELIKLVQEKGLLVSTSFSGGKIPTSEIIDQADFVLLHGNGVDNAKEITEMVDAVKNSLAYTNKPILFNEDDHFMFEEDSNNFKSAIVAYASWGYFDFRMEGESYEHGFQSVPVDWTISSKRKKSFFNKIKDITSN
ncbi:MULTISPECIES: hypothetical protein [unclassified Saccharicrinis]|uniref:hypothetical protein n=1 Tax=unclassified Saccharicrinis TaxID=2646859 RepID=UPI003D3325A4